MGRAGFLLLTACLIGCGPKVKSFTYVDVPPLPSYTDVAVFADSLPTCEYEQVGLIASDDMKRTLDRARKMGADGVIGTVLAESSTASPKSAVCGTPKCVTFNTVAIRFSDPACRR